MKKIVTPLKTRKTGRTAILDSAAAAFIERKTLHDEQN
jgi:hypothetical protein